MTRLSARLAASVIAVFVAVQLSPGPAVADLVTLPDLVTLEGKFTQGGLVMGRTIPTTTVEFEGREVPVSPDGIFLVGFGRDAPPKATLKLRYIDGTEEVHELDVAKREYDIQRLDGLPKKMVTPPPEAWEQIKADNVKIGRVRKLNTPETWFLSGWIWPADGPVTGVYGSQRILNGEARRPHYGHDIAGPVGSPVVAPADGRVALAETGMYYTGNTVMLDHGHGLTTVFLHMSEITVKAGQFVRRGEQIGAIGATGRVTGPHLDWRVNLFRTRLDPAYLLPPRPEETQN